MIPMAVQRSIWLTVGLLAALWCGFGVVVLVGMGLIELLAPGSTESSGPSPVLVLAPWLVGAYVLARWALRRSDTLLPAIGDQPTAQTGAVWRFEGWMARHRVWAGVLVVLVDLSLTSLITGVVLAVVFTILIGLAQLVIALLVAVLRRRARGA